MNFVKKIHAGIFFITSLVISHAVFAEALLSSVCSPFELIAAPAEPEHFNQGILFRVEKAGMKASHIFGTMHVGDADIVNLPAEIDSIFQASDRYVMEVYESQEETIAATQTMFYRDGTTLSSMVDPLIFNRLIEIFEPYGVNERVADFFKPWAAFLTISYPPPKGLPLDLVLAERSKAAGKNVHGLETGEEQLAIFMDIKHDDQIKMLNDTVCHYDKVQQMIVETKELYLQQEIGILYSLSYRYAPEDKELFEALMQRFLTQRNINMAKRMQPLLEVGNSFVAVGALHLPAKEGVLYLLQQQGYTITKVY